jgi:hypothetical protein
MTFLAKLAERAFELQTTNHAEAIVRYDFPDLADDLETALLPLQLPLTEVIAGGGGEAKMTQRLRKAFTALGWTKHRFDIKKIIDGVERESISHEIDHVRRTANGLAALEIEWNNKDPFFDRDLENFKRLHGEGAISFGVIVTRGSEMQAQMRSMVEAFASRNQIADFETLKPFGAGAPTGPQRRDIEKAVARGQSFAQAWAAKFTSDKFGQATTHLTKLQDRVARGVGNPCPLVLIGLPVSIVDQAA